MNRRPLRQRLLAGSTNVACFADLVTLAEGFDFCLARTRGSHHLFSYPNVPELLNLQPVRGQAKPYQVRQLLKLVEDYQLRLENDA
jgi:hypothetical protein